MQKNTLSPCPLNSTFYEQSDLIFTRAIEDNNTIKCKYESGKQRGPAPGTKHLKGRSPLLFSLLFSRSPSGRGRPMFA